MNRLQVLREKIAGCTACSLHREAQFPTPSSGPPSKVIFVGRNPGEQERDRGFPFVGQTEDVIDEMLSALGYTRDNVYLTNTVKCFTCQPRVNRPPTEQEFRTCGGQFLERELEIIQPEIIVSLGKDAFMYLSDYAFTSYTPFHSFTGKLFRIAPNTLRSYSIFVFAFHHPIMAKRSPMEYGKKMTDDFIELHRELQQRKLLGSRESSGRAKAS